MRILIEKGVDAGAVFAMGTVNGAEALQLPHDFGRLETGISPYLLAVPCEPEDGETPLEAVIRAGANVWAKWVISPKSGGIILTAADERDEDAA